MIAADSHIERQQMERHVHVVKVKEAVSEAECGCVLTLYTDKTVNQQYCAKHSEGRWLEWGHGIPLPLAEIRRRIDNSRR